MTDIWNVIVEDRHGDVDALPFSTEAAAAAHARELAGDMSLPAGWSADQVAHVPGEQPLTRQMIKDGWVLWLVHSIEGDCVRVVKRTLDGGSRP